MATETEYPRLDRQRLTPRHGARLVLSSAVHFPYLVVSDRLQLRHERLGDAYRLFDGRSYRVFRETTRALSDEPRTVVEVTFRLRVIRSAQAPHWLFERLCTLTTPFWSGFDGFGTKLWMVEPRSRSYAGIYEWRSPALAGAYLEVLLPVLRAVSVPGSVASEVHSDARLPAFLHGREQR